MNKVSECLASDALISYPWKLPRIVTETNACSNWLSAPLVGEWEVALTSPGHSLPPPPQLIFGRENRRVSAFVGVSVLPSKQTGKTNQRKQTLHLCCMYVWLLNNVKRGVQPTRLHVTEKQVCELSAVFFQSRMRMGRGPIGICYNNKQNEITKTNWLNLTVTFIWWHRTGVFFFLLTPRVPHTTRSEDCKTFKKEVDQVWQWGCS